MLTKDYAEFKAWYAQLLLEHREFAEGKTPGETLAGGIMRCDSDSGKKLIKSMVLRTADRQGMC